MTTKTTTTATPAAVVAIEKLTAQGAPVMQSIANGDYGWFDNGLTEGSGIWGECINEKPGVLGGLAKQGLLTSDDPDPQAGAGRWYALTALGAEVANLLAENAHNEEHAARSASHPAVVVPAPKKVAAKKAPAAKSGDPKADRAVAAAKVEKAHAAATKVAAKTPAKAAPAAKAKAERVLPTVPGGFVLKYDNGGYLLARNDGSTEAAPKWYVICTEHGTTTPADAAKEGDALGRRAARTTWCTKCRNAAK